MLRSIERNAHWVYFAGLAVVLLANHIGLPTDLRFAFFCGGLLLIVCGVFSRAGFNPWRELRSLANHPYDSERLSTQFWQETLLRLAHAVLYLGIAAFVVAASLYASQPREPKLVEPGSSVTTLQLSPGTDARLQALIQVLSTGQQRGSSTNLQLDPALRDALLKYLGRQSASGRDAGVSVVPSFWLFAFFAAAAVALVIFALRKRPDGAAAVSVLTLAGTALAYANHVARVDPDTYIHVVIALSILSGLIAMVCGAQVWRSARLEQKAATETAENVGAGATRLRRSLSLIFEKGITLKDRSRRLIEWLLAVLIGRKSKGKEPESPLVIALLPFLLLFTFCVVGYQATDGKGSTSRSSDHSEVLLSPLATRFSFERGSPLRVPSRPSPEFDGEVGTLESEINAIHPNAGDRIVLVGMADCSHFSDGNAKLAGARASYVSQLLEPYVKSHDLSIVALPLPQSESCKSSSDQRAVVPYFARATQTQRADRNRAGVREASEPCRMVE